jgi:hypothetical protein
MKFGPRQTLKLQQLLEVSRVDTSEADSYARKMRVMSKKNEKSFRGLQDRETFEDAWSTVSNSFDETVAMEVGSDTLSRFTPSVERAVAAAFEEFAPNFVGMEDLIDYDPDSVEEAEMEFVNAIAEAARSYFGSIAAITAALVETNAPGEEDEENEIR